MTTFENWCALNDVPSLPARPADVARFVTVCEPLGMEKIWPMIEEISRAHYVRGLADPTLGGWVSVAVNEIAKIDPPRSWPKDKKARFATLPYDLQVYLSRHEAQRDKEVRRAQSEAAKVKQALSEIQKPARTPNGNQSHTAA